MLPMDDLVYLLFLGLNVLVGSLSNAFIVAVNVTDLLQGRKLNYVDQIIVTVALNNLCSLFISAVDNMAYYLWESLYYVTDMYQVFVFLFFLLITTRSWLTASLCVFYCVKIVPFHHPLLSWFRLRLSILVYWILFVSTVGALALNLPVVWEYSVVFPSNATANGTEATRLQLVWHLPYTVAQGIFAAVLPFSFGVLSIALILLSLHRHAGRMNHNISQPQREALSRAVKTMSALLFLFLCFYLENILLIFNVFPLESMGETMCTLLIASYPTAQSAILIQGNSKLKSKILKMFHCAHSG
ncbi:taste receptor type 2 member 7-like [Lissotriton helveticus]